MDNFKIIYRILKFLEEHMDDEHFDADEISYEKLGISLIRWERLLWMMQEEGFITGLLYRQSMSNSMPHIVLPISPTITLKGLEYLEENTFMKKAAGFFKTVKEITPGL